MRNRKKKSGLTVNAIAGTHVVTLGLDLDDNTRKDCLGFAVQREDHTEDEKYWMRGSKTFEKTQGDAGFGDQFSTREHPLQSFQWADYSAKPGYEYTYKVVPMYGTPEKLEEGDAVSVKVETEGEGGNTHSVFFNRGAAGSQAYISRFKDKYPDEIGAPAYRWLSRGLFEALLNFLQRAEDDNYSIHGAIYEFEWSDALKACGDAAKLRKVNVEIIYDAIKESTADENLKHINAAGILDLCHKRTVGTIMHNKFFILSKKDGNGNYKPIAVWTGSTNLTENGIFGHSNCGHIVEDEAVAQKYMDYWLELKKDDKEIKKWIDANNIAPPNPWSDDVSVIFSPRTKYAALDWYAQIAAAEPTKPLFMTFPFGMDSRFLKIYERPDGVLRLALMEKEGNGKSLAQGKIDVEQMRKLPNVVIALGNHIKINKFDRWLATKRKPTRNAGVLWVHTKYMLIDPLSENPITVSGSANFSHASTDKNNENMLVIRGNTRVADIYLGEFMRLHSHYAFREAVAKDFNKGKDWKPQFLIPSDKWQQQGYFKPKQQRFLRREYFAG
jgi:phosphatidylserine/phosphatidylglycerophosphate/cardiolipin synthase-like enzyme